ncbi:hypothetical protein BU24DRAFT_447401 [Aaosphaeria arxii CBS 175.79]|uniref:Uncharacterized protein n=1 Tax=Aaosphaeria arxii CBS 175.79 TaxID=1450172 RepID=A0A6A5XZP2_9PLEO|nr:uncharacterized protein BU24DRAFT_447401 [Aaosphaeria arxii CBS 175.79]KAF2018768.1 hypothetical protein BU24DRAFT_447401 [Aaosphaeria arxii CBS 175.79]
MSDIDGDSTMHSSPELEAIEDDDNMFPDEQDGPSTPRNTASALAGRDSELSPPDSQGPANLPLEGNLPAAFSATPSNLNANGKRVHSSAAPSATGDQVHIDPDTGYQWVKQEDQPGWDWKNSRAREEELRALDTILDKGGMIKTRYGDPLDASIPARRR